MKSENISARTSSFARLTACTLLPLVTWLAACSDETVTMGEDGSARLGVAALPDNALCREDTTHTGDVLVFSQRELDALEGCQVVEGQLVISGFEDADLRPLHALRVVRGMLLIQMTPPADDTQTPLLASLEGLESLESAHGLRLSGLIADNVDPLSNLKDLSRGNLSITRSPNLTNLNGLARLKGVNDLNLECAALEDIAPLELPEAMTSLVIERTKLSQLSPLGVALVTGQLSVSGTQLRNLDAFAGLVHVGEDVRIENNPLIEDLDGLNELDVINALTVSHNASLTQLPELPRLALLGGLEIVGNARLTEVPRLRGQAVDASSLDPLSLLALTSARAIISDNPALTSISLPQGWLGGSALVIDENPALAQVVFTEQQSFDYLSITDNASLASVEIGALNAVDLLEVARNPQLDTSAFDPVQTFERRVTANTP